MVFVCNLQSIHSLVSVVILFTLKTCQPCHYIKPMSRHVNKNTQRSLGLPMVRHTYWEKYQKEALKKVRNESSGEVIVAGDGRHDSMGHSAKFYAYTICCNIPMIIHLNIVQVLFLLLTI